MGGSTQPGSCLLPDTALSTHLLVLPHPSGRRQVAPCSLGQWKQVGLGGRPVEGPLSLLPVMFCGISGFLDFYKLQWLEAILNWQKPQEGCFGRPGELHFHPGWEQEACGGLGF